jgi:Fe-S-cluster containining protein
MNAYRKKGKEKELRTFCVRCGTCCIRGGPILHQEDKVILLEGHAGHHHLVTLRKGEMAYDPVTKRLERIQKEFIKVSGKDEDWSCIFFREKDSSCEIYKHRFIECRLLKCWDPSDLINIIGKDTLSRADLINPQDPILEVIETHELKCPCDELCRLISLIKRGKDRKKSLASLSELVKRDISIRDYAKNELGLKTKFELFIFGRRFTDILKTHGISIRHSNRDLNKNEKEKS